MNRSAPSSRPSSTVSFSISPLIQVDLAVFSSIVSDHGVKRSEFTLDGHPVGRASIDKETDTIVQTDQVVRKIVVTNDEGEKVPVFIEDHEIEGLFEVNPNSMSIKAVQPASLFRDGTYVPKQPMSVEAAKRVVGKKKVENKVGQQLLAALLQALADDDLIAVCEITTRGIPKPAVLLPDGTLWLVRHEDEVRENRTRPEVEVPAEAVRQVRDQFLLPLLSEEPVDLTDTRSEKILALAKKKADEGDLGKPEAPEVAALAPTSADDLMALLSLGAG